MDISSVQLWKPKMPAECPDNSQASNTSTEVKIPTERDVLAIVNTFKEEVAREVAEMKEDTDVRKSIEDHNWRCGRLFIQRFLENCCF